MWLDNMKLVAKTGVFLNTAQKTNGDNGNFNIQMPYDYKFDPKQVFKIWISQVNLRNTFFYIRPENCVLYYCIDVDPSTLQPPGAALGRWSTMVLPYGVPDASQLCAILNEAFLPSNPTVFVTRRYGRLCVWSSDTAEPYHIVNFYFAPANALPEARGPCNLAYGFPSSGTIYTLYANQNPAGVDDRLPADGCTTRPADNQLSPQLMDANHLSNIVIKTDLPSDNYVIDKSGPSNNGITVNIPIVVPPGASILWQDTHGTYAVLEKGRSVVNSLAITVEDGLGKQLTPDHDWSFIVNIETYEDVDATELDLLEKSNKGDDQVIQLLKMLLLQKEFKGK